MEFKAGGVERRCLNHADYDPRILAGEEVDGGRHKTGSWHFGAGDPDLSDCWISEKLNVTDTLPELIKNDVTAPSNASA